MTDVIFPPCCALFIVYCVLRIVQCMQMVGQRSSGRSSVSDGSVEQHLHQPSRREGEPEENHPVFTGATLHMMTTDKEVSTAKEKGHPLDMSVADNYDEKSATLILTSPQNTWEESGQALNLSSPRHPQLQQQQQPPPPRPQQWSDTKTSSSYCSSKGHVTRSTSPLSNRSLRVLRLLEGAGPEQGCFDRDLRGQHQSRHHDTHHDLRQLQPQPQEKNKECISQYNTPGNDPRSGSSSNSRDMGTSPPRQPVLTAPPPAPAEEDALTRALSLIITAQNKTQQVLILSRCYIPYRDEVNCMKSFKLFPVIFVRGRAAATCRYHQQPAPALVRPHSSAPSQAPQQPRPE
mgnify:CR=1 FL=1